MALLAAARCHVALGKQSAGVAAHQQRPVAPIADEIAVVPAALDHQVGEAERQRAVGAGPHPKPDVGLVGETDLARVDHDQFHAAPCRLDGGGGMGQARHAGIVAPEDEAAGAGDVGHRVAGKDPDAADAEGEAGGERPTPAADLEARHEVRTTVGVHQPPGPDVEVGGSGRRTRGYAEGERLGSVPVGDPAHGCRRQIECFVPTDPLPAGIGVTLRARPLQRVKQPVCAMDEFRRGASLGAQRLTGRMRRIGFESDDAAVLDRRYGAAARDAEGTERFDLLPVVHGRGPRSV